MALPKLGWSRLLPANSAYLRIVFADKRSGKKCCCSVNIQGFIRDRGRCALWSSTLAVAAYKTQLLRRLNQPQWTEYEFYESYEFWIKIGITTSPSLFCLCLWLQTSFLHFDRVPSKRWSKYHFGGWHHCNCTEGASSADSPTTSHKDLRPAVATCERVSSKFWGLLWRLWIVRLEQWWKVPCCDCFLILNPKWTIIFTGNQGVYNYIPLIQQQIIFICPVQSSVDHIGLISYLEMSNWKWGLPEYGVHTKKIWRGNDKHSGTPTLANGHSSPLMIQLTSATGSYIIIILVHQWMSISSCGITAQP